MKQFIPSILRVLLLSALVFPGVCSGANALPPAKTNYVVFTLLGDCGGDDCIAAAKDALADLRPDFIVSADLEPLASHQTADYKTVTITFKDLRYAPYPQVISRFSSLGYKLVAYVIHDTHTGKDVIIPHK